MFHFIIDFGDRRNWDSMSYSILLSKTAGVDQTTPALHASKREAKVDARLSCRFELRDHVVAIERDDCLTRASLHIFAELETKR